MKSIVKGGLYLTVGILLMTACSPATATQVIPTALPASATFSPFPTFSKTPHARISTDTPSPVRSTALPAFTGLDPADWMEWPEIPMVTQHVREIYALGQSLGNDPQAFSIFGDCQSLPEIFMGLYVNDPEAFASLTPPLQETVNYFEGSFTRQSPTSKDGTTSGALLWSEWHENKFGCTAAETPMECELRVHNPSFVLIMVGTHWEGTRNEFYMHKILDALLERGIVPILSTKADNREGDNSVNLQTAKLAAEYNIPLWNFWPVTAELPNRGLYTKEIDRHLGDIYLTEEALNLHRYSALQALDIIWRAATGN